MNIKKAFLFFRKHGIKKTAAKIFDKIQNKYFPNISQKKEYYKLKKHYNNVCKKLKEKIKAKQKITVAFFVIYDSDFKSQPLFKKMLGNNSFEPVIIIVPDTYRGKENMCRQVDKSYQKYKTLYGEKKVLLGYIKETDNFVDYSDQFDIFCFTNPYEDMTHTFFRMEYLKTKNVLNFFIKYGRIVTSSWAKHVINSSIMCMFWKIFADDKFTFALYKKYQAIKGENVIISGFLEFDDYETINKNHNNRKCIIIAPHHTIGNEYKDILELSNFLEYADFFLELPGLYPDIDFIFRPHPLLFPRLEKDDMWGKEKTDAWLNGLLKNDNIMYSNGGDFIELFVNSDALIHDCGAFLIDYLFTGYPCCYMLRKNMQIENLFNKFGIKCLNQYYISYEKKDITDFIDNVVLKKIDPLKNKRERFSKKYLFQRYNAAEKIIKEIKGHL